MASRPWYVVFCGVNGSGKSTLYRTDLWRTADMPKRMERINPDELLRAQGGNWSSGRDQITAGKAALQAIEACFATGGSFNQETTLTGHRALKTIAEAHARGYRVHLLYTGVADAQIALGRIAHRVKTGGHNINEEVVRRRFHTSLSHFCKALPYCDEAQVFDNTIAFKRIALWKSNTLAWWGASSAVGAWLPAAMADEALWQRESRTEV